MTSRKIDTLLATFIMILLLGLHLDSLIKARPKVSSTVRSDLGLISARRCPWAQAKCRPRVQEL